MGTFFNYIANSHPVTWIVLAWLSIYFIITFTIYIGKKIQFSLWAKKESNSLEAMLMGAKRPSASSILSKCSTANPSAPLLNVCKSIAEKNATSGLSWLSIIASTSPFIGLFGTVVSILETFSKLGQSSSASLGVIAPAISEALIATAAGIFVAIPAYTFHIALKRGGYDIMDIIGRQIDLILSAQDEREKQTKNV